MREVEVVLQREKETRNSYRYREAEDEEGMPPVLGQVYLAKYAARRLGNPARIRVAVRAEEVADAATGVHRAEVGLR